MRTRVVWCAGQPLRTVFDGDTHEIADSHSARLTVEAEGMRAQYETANGILQLFVFLEGGKVVRVRPSDLPLADVVKTR
jgi:hypothetical protein